jgi:hypothetical protein
MELLILKNPEMFNFPKKEATALSQETIKAF